MIIYINIEIPISYTIYNSNKPKPVSPFHTTKFRIRVEYMMDGKENTFSIGISNTLGYGSQRKECKMTRIFKIRVKGIAYLNRISTFLVVT